VPPTFSEPCPQLPDTWEALPDPHPPVPTQPQITPSTCSDRASYRSQEAKQG
jgi:hypothetical protein